MQPVSLVSNRMTAKAHQQLEEDGACGGVPCPPEATTGGSIARETGRQVLQPASCGLSSPAIEELHLCGLGGVSLFRFFSRMKFLRYLWLSRNRLRSLTPLASCPSLREVYADNNELVAVPFLPASRGSLEVLSLAGNRIQTLGAQLAAVASFKRLRSLNLRDNPIATETFYRWDCATFYIQPIEAKETRSWVCYRSLHRVPPHPVPAILVAVLVIVAENAAVGIAADFYDVCPLLSPPQAPHCPSCRRPGAAGLAACDCRRATAPLCLSPC